jgi:hypothetical protein
MINYSLQCILLILLTSKSCLRKTQTIRNGADDDQQGGENMNFKIKKILNS